MHFATLNIGSRRLLGRKFDDEVVQRYIQHCPYKIVPSLGSCNDKKPMIAVSYQGKKKEFEAVEISDMILKKLKKDAEAYIGNEVKNAVITVSASFSNLQLQATKDAGVIAGFNVLRIIDVPTAAAMAYGYGKKAADGRRNLLVFGLGREYCEVYLVEIEKEVYKVKSTSENDTLGGQNFDNALVSYFVDEFKRKYGTNINQYPRVMNSLRVACEKVNIVLSSTFGTTIEINSLFVGIHFRSYMSRVCWNNLSTPIPREDRRKEGLFHRSWRGYPINADLTTSKRKIQSSSSYCDKLKGEIADIDASIARLMDQRASLESDLATAQFNLTGLTDYLTTQMELTKEHLNRFSSFQTAEKLEYDARHSLGVALDCLGSFFASL
ncbi:heat shock cognate 70 kDa protein-like [Silene latifolia]|uniref:heat shock cognate 70 kDa protein-like n=1 Tax=Silene latifolia TaxID=37657 RepID=UPI003D783B0F